MGWGRYTGWRRELSLWSLATVCSGLVFWAMGWTIGIRHILWRDYPVFYAAALPVYVLLSASCSCLLQVWWPIKKKRWLMMIAQALVCAWLSAAVGYFPTITLWYLDMGMPRSFSLAFVWQLIGVAFTLISLASGSWLFGPISAIFYLGLRRLGMLSREEDVLIK